MGCALYIRCALSIEKYDIYIYIYSEFYLYNNKAGWLLCVPTATVSLPQPCVTGYNNQHGECLLRGTS